MGRTNPTFRKVLKRLESDWQDYRRALRLEDKKHFERLFKKAGSKADASSYMNPRDPFKAFLFSVILEQEKEIHSLKSKV